MKLKTERALRSFIMVILLVVHHAFEDLVVDEVYRVGPEVQEYVVNREED